MTSFSFWGEKCIISNRGQQLPHFINLHRKETNINKIKYFNKIIAYNGMIINSSWNVSTTKVNDKKKLSSNTFQIIQCYCIKAFSSPLKWKHIYFYLETAIEFPLAWLSLIYAKVHAKYDTAKSILWSHFHHQPMGLVSDRHWATKKHNLSS